VTLVSFAPFFEIELPADHIPEQKKPIPLEVSAGGSAGNFW
jgi:hypothetical protein